METYYSLHEIWLRRVRGREVECIDRALSSGTLLLAVNMDASIVWRVSRDNIGEDSLLI